MHAKDLFAVVSLIDRLTAKRKTAKHYRKTNHK